METRTQVAAAVAVILVLVALVVAVLREAGRAHQELLLVTQPLTTVLAGAEVVTNQVVVLVRVVLGIKVLLLSGGDSNNALFCKSS